MPIRSGFDFTVKQDIQQDINKSLAQPRLNKAEERVLRKMDEIKNRQSRQGNSPAKGGRWDNRYSKQYANKEKGGRRSPVTLRNRTQSIKKTRVRKSGKYSELQFENRRKGVIFGYHHRGINYSRKGFTRRQIYPTADNQVPKELDLTAEKWVFKYLTK